MFENLTKVKVPSEFKPHCKFHGKQHLCYTSSEQFQTFILSIEKEILFSIFIQTFVLPDKVRVF